MHNFHFISGLPRSGSTLLAAVLKQNPKFHAGMTSPIGDLFRKTLEEISSSEYSVFVSEEQRQRILTGLFDSYYGREYPEVVFDTHRWWCSQTGTLEKLFPTSKVIACVRHLGWIVDSFENLAKKNPLQLSSIYNYSAAGTVYSRAESISGSEGVVGYSFNALREAYYCGNPNNLMLVQYETMVKDPSFVMKAIYDFIGEPYYEHDFTKVEYQADEFDRGLGAPGLHTVSGKIESRDRKTVLPPDLFARYGSDSFWLDPSCNVQNIMVI
jgi:sulfotransferase